MSLTGLAFVLAFLAGMFLVARHPVYGLYTYVALFYLNPASRWWGEALPDIRWSLIAGVVTLIAAWRLPPTVGRVSWVKTTPARMLIFFTLWLWIQSFWALDRDAHIEACLLFTKYVVLYYLIYRLIITPADTWRFLMAHLAGCAYFGYLAFVTPSSGRLEGVGGPGVDDANSFAMQMGTGVVVGAMIVLARTGIWRWFAIAVMPFILNGIILSGSRGGFVALLGGGLILWYLRPQVSRTFFYALACLAVLLFGVLARDPEFWVRIQSIQAAAHPEQGKADDSAMSRWVIAGAQLEMARSYPLGTGHRGTVVLSPEYIPEEYLTGPPEKRRRASHNTFMTALVEQGVPGAIYFIWLWIWTFGAVRRLKQKTDSHHDYERRSLLGAVAAGLAAIFVAGIFGDYIKAEVHVWLLALLASLGASTVIESNEQPVSAATPRAARAGVLGR